MPQLTQAIITLSVTSLVLLALPIICVLIWKKHSKASWPPLFLGAAGFLLFALVLEQGVHMVCIVSDNPVSRAINGSTPLYMLYGALMAGIFEECGRFVFLRFAMKKHRTRENFVMYGIGHGGIEVWAVVVVATVSMLVVDAMVLTMGIQAVESLMDPAGTGDLAPALASASSFGPAEGVLYVIERVVAMSAHISFTIVVGYGVVMGRSRLYLPLAVLAHAGTDVFAALYQRGVVSLAVSELWAIVCAALLAVWAVKLYKKLSICPAGS